MEVIVKSINEVVTASFADVSAVQLTISKYSQF